MENIVVEKAKLYAKEILGNDSSGHDYWHVIRVYNNALKLAENRVCNLFVIKLAALLHDVDDRKIFGGTYGQYEKAQKFLVENHVDKKVIAEVCEIINKMSYKGIDSCKMNTIEGMVVQDADRLDALGAVGILRTFTFAGNKNEKLYDPNILPRDLLNAKIYAEEKTTTINHIYEVLLNLKDYMNTKEAKNIAEKRHNYLLNYLQELKNEAKCVDFDL